MPPSLVLLGLLAIAIPTAARALVGRPRLLAAALLASAIGALIAQVAGELARSGIGVIGDTQLGLAAVASAFATAVVALVEPRRALRDNPRRRTT
ncbi:MAG TPA: hypothetical protein VFA01_00175 [Candidatus Dormibacteraeota bacterium]|jgi:hypothetical protein|nr:hypothetical protein [Candidatus Dormibacteraeota bacterium]